MCDKEEGTLGISKGMAMERNDVSCKFDCVEETYPEENVANEKNGLQFDPKIVRDNEYDLSFKYIASPLKSNALPDVHELAKPSLEGLGGTYDVNTRHRLSLDLLMLKKEGSDRFENYLSFSHSPSRVNSDSDFDFPSPSEESRHVAKPSDFYFEKQVFNGPHQREWQAADADDNSTMATDQESNSSVVSGIEIVDKRVSAVEAQAELKGKECAEDNFAIKQDLPIAGLIDSFKTFTGVYSHLQSEKISEAESLTKERRGVAHESTVSVLHECDSKGSLTHSVSNEGESQLSESTATNGDKNLWLKPSNILRRDSKLLGTDSSTSTSLSTGQMKACSTIDTLDGVRRKKGPMAMSSVAYGDYTGNNHFDLRKEVKVNGRQKSWSSEQLGVSQKGSKSERRYAMDDLHDKGQLHKIEVLEITDPKQHYKRNCSSYAEPSLNSKDMYDNYYQESIQDADLYPPPQRSSEGLFGTNKRCAQANEILADSSFQAQNCQADLYPVGYTDNYVDASNAFPAGSCSNGCDAPFIGSRSSGGNTACSSQASVCPFMLPFPIHSHPFSHDVYHSVCPVCIPHFHGQGFFFPPLSVPSCSHCLTTMGHYQGHPDLQCHNCGFHVKGPCMFCHSLKCCSLQSAGVHDTSFKAVKASTLPLKKPKKYPPLPQERMAPYVVCRGCNDILDMPGRFSFCGGVQKLRCGACGTISKFSAHKNSPKPHIVDSRPSRERAMSKSSPLSFEVMAKRREQTVRDLGQRGELSNDKRLLERSKHYSVSSNHLTGGPHNLQGEEMLDLKPSQDGHDAKLSSARNNHNSQDEFGSARSLLSGFKTLSSRFEVKNARSGDISLQCVVDEKEEGLAFGAPRSSDEDFSDQRSAGKFDSMDQPMQKKSFREDEAHASEIQPESQSDHKTGGPMRTRLTLYTLFNQESTKFLFAIENEDPLRESTYGLQSPALKAPLPKPRNQKALSKEKKTAPLNFRTDLFIRKGPRQIAALITRSWKH